jgi:HD-like signal output (HDOD) protein
LTALSEFIAKSNRMPAPPAVISRLIELVNDQDSSTRDLARLIRTDATLTAKLLKMANSPFYGKRGRITTVDQAAVLLGFKTIRSVVLAIWTRMVTSDCRDPMLRGTQDQMFIHGLACGVGASLIVKRIAPALVEDTFTAGMLHDLGRVAFIGEVGAPYVAETLERSGAESKEPSELERERFGFDHSELGVELVQKWGLPSVLAETVKAHHEAEISVKEQPVVAAVALADHLATLTGYNTAPQAHRTPRTPLLEPLGLSKQEELDAFQEQWQQALQELRESIG